MNCLCDLPARYLISRDGKPCYTCSVGRCRFFAMAPVQCEGYTRVILGAPGCPPADSGVVLRFEALVHPDDTDATAFMIRVQGEPQRWDALRREVLQDPQYEGMWYPNAKAFLYPLSHYHKLVSAVKARAAPNTALEEIPSFYFRCVEKMRGIPAQHALDVAGGRAGTIDVNDCVYRQLKPFQKDGVRFVIEHQGRAMIADDMGLGKTVQAIAVAHHYRDEWPVLVVCPMSLLENWAKEFNKFCGIPYARIAILQGTKARVTSLQDVVIVSYSSLKCVEEAHFNVIILDESHYIKAGAAKRAQLSLKLCRESRRVLLLSGTPAMSRPIELYAQLQAMQPTTVPSRQHYGARYCNSYVSRFGIDVTGHSHTDELHSLLRHYIIRRTKKELSGELPSKSRQLLYVYVTDKEKKALEKQIVALRHSIAASSSSARGGQAAAQMDVAARAPNAFEMKMATARAKIPAVQDYVSTIVEQHLDSGEKIILFAHHQCMMEALKAAVEGVRPRQPIDYIYISGDTPAAQREPAAEHFRSEPTCTVAILSMQSSGTGHNFTCASTVVFTELDWNPSTHLQCEDRVHRIGQAQPCHIKYLLAEGTSDSVIWPLLQSKLTVTTAMFEHTSTAAEARLHDGADTRNVARRDVTSSRTSGGGGGGGGVTLSQQSTLDRFLPSASKAEERQSGAVEPPKPAQLHATSPASAHQSADGVVSPQGHEGNGTSSLPLTPTSLSQQLADCPPSTSALSPPLNSSSAGTKPSGDRSKTAGPSLLVPFSEMGNVFAAPSPCPPKPPRSSLQVVPGGGGARSDATDSPQRRSKGHAGGPSADTTSRPTAASVLQLMRHTAAQTTAGSAAVPIVVDSAPPTVSAPQPSRVPSGPSPPAVVLSTLSSLAAPGGAAAAAPAPPRRTVFTFAQAKPTTASAGVAPASSSSSPPPVATAASPLSSPPVTVVPPGANTSSPHEAVSAHPSAAVAAVHVSLRPSFNFKRPRAEATAGGDASAASRLDGTSAAASTAPPPPHPATAVQAAPALSLQPPPPHAPSTGVPAGGMGDAFPFPVPLAVHAAGSGGPPRRTLFKLVSNAAPEQQVKKT